MARHRFLPRLAALFERARYYHFDWDEGNRGKSLKKHGINDSEAESVFRARRNVILGVQISPKTEERRYGAVGAIPDGRVLAISFTLRSRMIRVISARPAKRKERRQYEEKRS